MPSNRANADQDPFLAQDIAEAGPNARPYIRRSQYLARALQAMHEGSQQIRSPQELGVRLLAEALTQYGRARNDRQLAKAQAVDTENEIGSMSAALYGAAGLPNPAAASKGDAQSTAPSMDVQTLARALGASGPPTPQQPLDTTQADAAPAIPHTPTSASAVAGLGAGSGVGTSPTNRETKTRDAIIRLLALESPTEQGQQAVGNVVLNRGATGMDLADVISQPHQFEPFGNPTTWARGMAIPADSPQYRQAERAWDAAQQQDITGGALNFYGPESQRQLAARDGRPVTPDFARQGGGQRIGGNVFFPGSFAPPAGYTPPTPEQLTQSRAAPAVPPPPPPPPSPNAQGVYYNTAPTPVDPVIGSDATAGPMSPIPSMPGDAPGAQGAQVQQGAPPVPPQPPAPQTMGRYIITPQVIAQLEAMMRSGDPRQIAFARQQAMQLQMQAQRPLEMQFGSMSGAPIGLNPYDPTHPVSVPVPPQYMTQTGPAQQFGVQAPPGTVLSRTPTGNFSTTAAPPAGQMVTSAPGQPYAEAPVPGSARDPNSPAARLEGLRGVRQEVAPILNAATQLHRNISAVRTGFQQHNGAGDIAMVNGLQRLIDEGVVREGDVNMQLQAQGLRGGIAGLMGFISSSGRFDDRIRAQLLATANQLYADIEPTFRDRVLSYRGIAERAYGPGAFEDVVPTATLQAFGWSQPAQRAPAQGGQGGNPGSAPGPQSPAPPVRVLGVR